MLTLERSVKRTSRGGEMKRTLFSVAVLASLVLPDFGCQRPEKNELTGIIGRTFVSDQGVTGISTPGTFLTRARA